MFEEDGDYIRVTLLLKKSTYDGLKNLEGIYCVSLEGMLEIEADKLLDRINVNEKDEQ